MSALKNIKYQLFAYCREQVSSRIASAREAIDALQLAANEETKSSAGDKYETSRAMMQLEKDKYAQQLAHTLQLKKVMDQVDPEKEQKTANLGSLVKTNHGAFYIAISLGQHILEGASYFIISPVSPLGKACSGLTAGNSFSFNGKAYEIEEVV